MFERKKSRQFLSFMFERGKLRGLLKHSTLGRPIEMKFLQHLKEI